MQTLFDSMTASENVNQLKQTIHLLQYALDSDIFGVLITDHAGQVKGYNNNILNLLGLSEDSMQGERWKEIFSRRLKDPGRLAGFFITDPNEIPAERTNKTMDIFEFNDGRLLECRTRFQYLEALQGAYRVWCFSDCTEQQRRERELLHLGLHDPLTGMYNRAYFDMHLRQLRSSQSFPVSMVMVDVDGLKKVNDGHGHMAGDDLLRQAAHILQQARRSEDICARIGGDEFGLLLIKADEGIAERVTDRIFGLLNLHNIRYPEAPISLSMGYAVAASPLEIDDLVSRADGVMYEARRKLRLPHSRPESE